MNLNSSRLCLPIEPREFGFHIDGAEEYTKLKSVHIEIGKRNHWVR